MKTKGLHKDAEGAVALDPRFNVHMHHITLRDLTFTTRDHVFRLRDLRTTRRITPLHSQLLCDPLRLGLESTRL